MSQQIVSNGCRVSITLNPTFALMVPTPPPSPLPVYKTVHSTVNNNNNNNVVDEEDDSDFKIVEYGDLPLPVQEEVVEYLTSDEFIQSDRIETYVLKEITSLNYTNDAGGPNGPTCKILYPQYDINITNVNLYVRGKQLFVTVDGILVLTPLQEVIKREKGSHLMVCKKQVTVDDVTEIILDGYHKASHSGALISEYGNYLGEFDNRYMVYFDYSTIKVNITC